MRVRQARRSVWLALLFLLIGGALSGRLYQLQVVKGPLYARLAYAQRTLSLPVSSRRGLILDRNGEPLTDPRPGWGVAAFPPLVKDAPGAARVLANLLGKDEAEVLHTLTTGTHPAWIEEEAGETLANRVREMRIPGVVAAPVGVRYGPNSIARHLVGYVNSQGGQQGLEWLYQQELGGDAVPALVAYLDGNGAPLAGLGVRTVTPATGKPPYQVETTLDASIQRAVERVLDSKTHPDGGAWRGAVVVMEPRTGSVLAMASRPDYDQVRDPGVRPDPAGEAFLLNRATSAFEPGSVFKSIVAAAALDLGKVDMDERFYCSGHYDVGGQRFADADGGAHGWLTFSEAVARSCNVVMARVGYERLGAEGLLESARRFGFGVSVGTGLREESAGFLPRLQYGGLVAQFAFGQGLLVTPLQMARAYAAIANGGVLPPVRLVTAVRDPSGRVMERPDPGRPEQVISPAAAAQLHMALLAVTDPKGSGTGRKAWLEGGVAGKTGSAEGTEFGRPAVHAWFAGYLPAAAPRYVIVVMVQGGGAGGAVAAPLFREIGAELLRLERSGGTARKTDK